MALQSITNINVDFYDKKYILINAKQYDKNSRFLSVTCYDHGEICSINSGEHSAYARYKKADGHSVFNFCEIDRKGKILVELTEQMLAVEGVCCVDLVIVNKGDANVDADTGEIVNIDNASILSTMTFYIDVSETAVENSEIESSYEFNLLNTKISEYWADFEDVMKTSKSWAVGNAGVRDNENTDNSKYYSEQSYGTAISASQSATNAKSSEEKAAEYMAQAQIYMESAKADAAEVNNKLTALADAFLPMGTITYEELKELYSSGALSAGYLYQISDNFTTDGTFKVGSGVEYSAGTNVYFTADGFLDCSVTAIVAGVKGDTEIDYRTGNVNITAENIGAVAIADIATVDEMKSYLGI